MKYLYKMETINFKCLIHKGEGQLSHISPKGGAGSTVPFYSLYCAFPACPHLQEVRECACDFLPSIPQIPSQGSTEIVGQDDRQEADCWTGSFHSCPIFFFLSSLDKGGGEGSYKLNHHTAFYNPLTHSLQKQEKLRSQWFQLSRWISRCCIINGVLRILLWI